MIEDQNNAVIMLLATDALEAAQDQAALASILLIDAVACIIITRLQKAGAQEMAGHMANYLLEQVKSATEVLRP